MELEWEIVSPSNAVMYCTLLAKAQNSAERARLEEKMKAEPELTAILEALTETEKEDLIQEERARKAAARQTRVDADLEAMETDDTDNVSEQLLTVRGVMWGML